MDPTAPAGYKICPSCAEPVRAAAARCRFCGHSFASGRPSDAPAPLPTISRAEILDCLETLAERSLLLFDVESGRFRMLDTVREYAKERSEPTDIRHERHAAYFADQAEQQKSLLQTADAQPALLTLSREEANARAALDWASGSKEGVDVGMRLCGALALFWHIRGQFREARSRCASALQHARRWPDRADPSMLGAVYSAAGNLASAAGDPREARELLRMSLQLRDSHGNKDELASTLHNLAIAESALGNLNVARELEDRALRLNRELGHKGRIASNLNSLGMIAAQHGDDEAALGYYLETADLAHTVGDRWTTLVVLYNLAELFERMGDAAQARLRLSACFGHCRDLEAWSIAGPGLDLLARLEYQEGRLAEAAYALGMAESIRMFVHMPRSMSETEHLLGLHASIATAPPEIRAELERGKATEPHDALLLTLSSERQRPRQDAGTPAPNLGP